MPLKPEVWGYAEVCVNPTFFDGALQDMVFRKNLTLVQASLVRAAFERCVEETRKGTDAPNLTILKPWPQEHIDALARSMVAAGAEKRGYHLRRAAEHRKLEEYRYRLTVALGGGENDAAEA